MNFKEVPECIYVPSILEILEKYWYIIIPTAIGATANMLKKNDNRETHF